MTTDTTPATVADEAARLIERVEAYEAKATKGPWERYGIIGQAGLTKVRAESSRDVACRATYREIPSTEQDSFFCVCARTDLPHAIRLLRALLEENAELRGRVGKGE